MRRVSAASTGSHSPTLHYGLWAAQVLLGLAFGAAGVMKVTQPIEALADAMGWAGAVPAALVRFIGTAEILGALGLILPAATRIKPALTPLAAAGLTTIMTLASLFHVSRGEFGALPINLILGAVAAFIAWGRWTRVPIAPRSPQIGQATSRLENV